MNLMPIYPKKNLRKLGEMKYIRPYLLRNLKVERNNQVWAIDITYIPMDQSFMYLNPSENGTELFQGLSRFFEHCNFEKTPPGIARRISARLYLWV